MKDAYKRADGRKLDGRRVLVDVERGRTVPNWRPRRLGGGLGSTRIGGEDANQKHSGREPQQIASGGHSRSDEPRPRDDRDREKSRERRDREREREKSRERSHDRPRDRDLREDRHHHRDRDRTRDRERDSERDRRDRDRGRDRVRERDHDRARDRDRERDHPREREHERDRDHYDRSTRERSRARTQERDADYEDTEPDNYREGLAGKARGYSHVQPVYEQALYDGADKHKSDYDYDQYERQRSSHYEDMEPEYKDHDKVAPADYQMHADELEEGEF